MLIRKADTDDAEALAKIHIDSWRSAYKGLVPDSHLKKLDYNIRAHRFHESLSQNSEITYLIENDNKIIGFVTLGNCRDTDVKQIETGEIWGIYLAPEYWRQGIGTKLCYFGENLLKKLSSKIIVLWVFAANDKAICFYEAMGYKADGALKIIECGKPLEAVRYRKELK